MKKTRPLVIVGDSAFAEVAYEYYTRDSPYRVVAFAVERAYKKKESLFGIPVVAFEDLARTHPPADHDVYVAIVYTQLNRLRARLLAEAMGKGYAPASYVSPKAFVWPNVKLGRHCFVFEDNTLQPFVTVGDDVVLWSGNHIGHHSRIGDHVFISSHVVVSGSCSIGDHCFLGVNAAVANDVKVARDCWVAPGVVIVKDTLPGQSFKPPRHELARKSAPEFFQLAE